MEVEYVLTPKDVIAFNIYQRECRPWWRRHVEWWAGCLFFVALTAAIRLWSSWSTFFVVFFIVFCIALWTAHSLLDWRRGVANRVRKWVRRHNKDLKLLGWRRCSIQPEGVTFVTEDSSSTIKWTGIVNIGQTAEHGFFYYTPKAAIIVPRQPFASEQDFHAFVETARNYWQGGRACSEPPSPQRVGGADTRITRDLADPGA